MFSSIVLEFSFKFWLDFFLADFRVAWLLTRLASCLTLLVPFRLWFEVRPKYFLNNVPSVSLFGRESYLTDLREIRPLLLVC